MAAKKDFIVEIGTEELPPKSLFTLAAAFAEGVQAGMSAAAIDAGETQWFATPRRLTVYVKRVAETQRAQTIKRQGPAVAAAFDAQGAPTKAALGFAASCGVELSALTQADGPKGKVLQYEGVKEGQPSSTLFASIVSSALDSLPIAKRMRWGSGDAQFVRPVQWVLMLFGADVVAGRILGVTAGNTTRGHRFHAPRELKISSPSRYLETLKSKGYVLANVVERRETIRSGAIQAANQEGDAVVIDDDLLNEVTALVEWPVPFAGSFEARFLELPSEVPIAVMKDHQRYFAVRDAAGKLRNRFVAVANIESLAPDKVREGNERVIRPRLSDAAFFWDMDKRVRLVDRCEQLRAVAFQAKLGSLFDKTARVKQLASLIAATLSANKALVERAATLCKCDLLSLMVGEFPELQGMMGRYYASHDGEPDEVAIAIEEHYLPCFAGDRLPQTMTGTSVSIADKLDTIAGIFAIGQRPTGTKDPFGLRRSALGVLRMIVELGLELDLRKLIREAIALQPVQSSASTAEEIWDYMLERLRAYYVERQSDQPISEEMFEAVLANRPPSPLDFEARLQALAVFLKLPDAPSLASANKRIANILRKSEQTAASIDESRLLEPAERALFESLQAAERQFRPLYERRAYSEALHTLAGLRAPVDRFFDSVMVMAEDTALRVNRLALLARLRGLFMLVADLSKLPG